MSPFVHVRRWSAEMFLGKPSLTRPWFVICDCCPYTADMHYVTWRTAYLSACVHAYYHEPNRIRPQR